MQVKQLWNSVIASTKLVWDRITFSKLTIAYFAFSLVHFVVQLSFQVKAFTINADAAAFLRDVVVEGNAVNNSLPILRGDNLFLCSWVPSNLDLDDEHCPVIWDGTNNVNAINAGVQGSPFLEATNLSSTCVRALNWPLSVLHDTIREDIVFIAFQFWVLGMSVVALLNESIPHTLASLVTHMIATAWAAFQIVHTADFKSNFNRVITNGACDGVPMSLLAGYWRDRSIAEWTSFAFNVLALLISSFLTWKLFRSFGWQTYKRVGASLTINRIYKIVLTLSITIQLSMFFMVVTVALWIDQLFNSAIGDLVDFKTLYKVSSFTTLVLLVPWLMTGWFAVRRELRMPMFIFLVLSILYLGGWSVMFLSTTFRWSFVTWRFFSIMAIASVLLTVVSLVLGVVCRYNFGKGLLRYLDVQQKLPDDDCRYYERYDEEKVDFPSDEKLIPTFAAALGQGLELSHPHVSRFFNSSEKHFKSASTSLVTQPPNAYTIARNLHNGPSYTDDYENRVMRSDTCLSDKSFASLANYYMYSDGAHSRPDNQKRWIIE